MNLGDGFVLKVSKADFQGKSSRCDETSGSRESSTSDKVDDFLNSVLEGLDTFPSDLHSIRSCLPQACKAESFFVVQLKQVYDSSVDADSEELAGVQVNSGSPFRFPNIWQNDLLLECCKVGKVKAFVVPDSLSLVGSILVSYEEAKAAQACAENYRSSTGREAVVFSPNALESSVPLVSGEVVSTGSSATYEPPESAEIGEDLTAGVDDFLNSLL